MLTALVGAHGLVVTPSTLRTHGSVTRMGSVAMKDPKGWPNFKETQVEAFNKG